ncbi:MAG: hypothetical protein ACFCU3_04670 [Verrucomicrobiales bacterium]
MEKFLNQLEKRFGHWAIPGLIKGVVLLNAIVYLLAATNPEFVGWIFLHLGRVMQGEVWRLVTYLFIPPLIHPLFLFFFLYLLWLYGSALEQHWGAFRLTAYYVFGALGSIIAAVLLGGVGSSVYLNTSIFFAFATLYPNFELRLFLIFPVKIKWLALIGAAFIAYDLLVGPLPVKAAILVSFANYLLFFGPTAWQSWKASREIAARRAKFDEARAADDPWLHRCEECGATDLTHPDRDFRVIASGDELCEVCLKNKA